MHKFTFNRLFPEPVNDPNYISPHIYTDTVNSFNRLKPLIVPRCVEKNICDEIIRYYDSQKSQDRSYQGMVNKELRDCRYVFLPENYYHIMDPFIQKLSNKFKYEFKDGFSAVPLIYKYEKGVGMKPHHDMITRLEIERCKNTKQPLVGGDFTIVLFLNDLDDEQGGALNFLNFENVCIIPKVGTAAGFCVNLIHEVTPIKFGSRYTIVCRIFINN